MMTTKIQLYNNAIKCAENGKYHDAINLFLQLPQTNDILYAIATCYKNTGLLTDMLTSRKLFIDLMKNVVKNRNLKEDIKTNYVSLITYLIQYHINASDYQSGIQEVIDALQLIPNDPILIYNLGHLYKCIGKYEGAITYLHKALNFEPCKLDTYLELICSYKDTGRIVDAIDIIKLGLKNIKNCIVLYNELGVIYTSINQHKLADEAFQKAVNFCTANDKQLLCKININVGHMYSVKGNFKKALECYKIAIDLDPTNMIPVQNYMMDLLYVPITDESESSQPKFDYQTVLASHFKYGNIVSNHYNIKDLNIPVVHNNLTIHIGYISGDFFGSHPMTYFLKTLLCDYNADKFTVHCYSTENINNSNKYSSYIKWRQIKYLTAKDCIGMMRNDKLDILFDLSGHTSSNKMDIFANRIAKYQISYLGYPCITGMPNIDYYLIDDTFNFKGSKFLTLPNCFTHYAPRNIPMELIQPYHTNKYITFGTLNKLTKINTEVIKLWDHILDIFPNTKLIIKKNDVHVFRNQDRVIMIDITQNYDDYIKQYNIIDIALDTFPYAGTTTTCESLLMGTPVITLADRKRKTIHQNTTASLLLNSNLNSLIAETQEQYIDCIKNVMEKIKCNENYKYDIQSLFVNGNVMNSTQYINSFETLMEKIVNK